MAFMEDMKNKFAQASQSTMAKAKEIQETAKLNSAINDAEKKINQIYGQIGSIVYNAYRENPMPEVAEFFAEIDGLNQKIEESKAQLKTINAANTCPQCGAKIKNGMAFCSGCGYKIEAPAPEVAPEAPAGKVCECGAVVEEGMAFCTSCGRKVE